MNQVRIKDGKENPWLSEMKRELKSRAKDGTKDLLAPGASDSCILKYM